MVILGEKGQRKTKLIKRALASLTEHETESWEFSDTQTAVKFIARRPLTHTRSLAVGMYGRELRAGPLWSEAVSESIRLPHSQIIARTARLSA